MRANHNAKEEVKNLFSMLNSLGTEHVQINSITVIPETQKKQEFGMADIEELDQDEKDNDPIIEINEEANINYITVNKIRIGKVYFQ